MANYQNVKEHQVFTKDGLPIYGMVKQNA